MGLTKRDKSKIGSWWEYPKHSDITRQAKQVWRFVYGEPWPKGWKVRWVRDKNWPSQHSWVGICIPRRKLILLEYCTAVQESAADLHVLSSDWRVFFLEYPEYWRFGGVMDTLLHEFVHLRHPEISRHGVGFYRRLAEAKRRLMRGCAPVAEAREAA